MYSITAKTALVALGLSLARLSLAAQCAAEAYTGGNANGCTGRRLASSAQSGEGTSACEPAVNAACADITHEVDGEKCSVILFTDADCNDLDDYLPCDDDGDFKVTNFGSFQVTCSE